MPYATEWHLNLFIDDIKLDVCWRLVAECNGNPFSGFHARTMRHATPPVVGSVVVVQLPIESVYWSGARLRPIAHCMAVGCSLGSVSKCWHNVPQTVFSPPPQTFEYTKFPLCHGRRIQHFVQDSCSTTQMENKRANQLHITYTNAAGACDGRGQAKARILAVECEP